MCRTLFSILFGIVCFLLVSCKPGTPDNVLSQSKMEAILYDYHLSQGAAACVEGDKETLRYQYSEAVFKKHGITRQQFDSSMEWYCAHSELLHKMYERLNARFDSEAKGLGVGVSETELYANMSEIGDTANIWSGPRIMFLENNRLSNLSTLTMQADTTFRPGDNYMLSFTSNFLNSANREAYAFLSVAYKDSVTNTTFQRISSNYNVQINLPKRTDREDYETEKITITFFYPIGADRSSTSYFFVTNPALMRFHAKLENTAEVSDSLTTDSLTADTLSQDTLKMDSVRVSSALPVDSSAVPVSQNNPHALHKNLRNADLNKREVKINSSKAELLY